MNLCFIVRCQGSTIYIVKMIMITFGACKKAKCKQQSECYGKRPDGLTVKEVAMLDYYSDQKKSVI